jgi:hypothetical protein
MSRQNPSVAVIRQEFRVRGHPIGLEKAEELRAVLEKAGTVTGLSPRDVLEITAINAKGGALDRLFVMVSLELGDNIDKKTARSGQKELREGKKGV